MQEWLKERDNLVQMANNEMFSAHINLDEDKRNLKAEKKLFALRR